jgi:2'-5' RNA ligase
MVVTHRVQTLALLLPEPFASRVVDARAALAEDPALGRIQDPPFAHFTLQMAEDYEWDGLADALARFARQQAPIPIRTVGLLTVTGPSTGITVEPYRDDRLARFHAEFWEVVTPFARGSVAPFYLPDRWVPHVTIKRCGPHRAAFGRAMATLSDDTFIWTMQVEQISVQHDPANNNLTRYQRLRVPLGNAPHLVPSASATNATIVGLEVEEEEEDEAARDGEAPIWCARVRGDDGAETRVRWTAPEAVRITAAAKAPLTYFAGARCRLDEGAVSTVLPLTPHPIA